MGLQGLRVWDTMEAVADNLVCAVLCCAVPSLPPPPLPPGCDPRPLHPDVCPAAAAGPGAQRARQVTHLQ